MIFAMAACAEYTPQQDDFELSVALEKTEFIQGEVIEYTVTLTRKGGPYFKFKGSSTLCSRYFEPLGMDEEPYFGFNADIVTHRIPKNYKYEETDKILTEYYEPGEYLFAICFLMKSLEYDFERVITIIAR